MPFRKKKFVLFGNENINVEDIKLDSLIFGNDKNLLMSDEPLEGSFFEATKRMRGRKKGQYFAKLRDINGDGETDLIVKALRSDISSVMDASDTDLFAFGQMGESAFLFENTNVNFI